jgi:cytoskeletal protein RodZ
METITVREGFIYAFLIFYILYALGGIGMTGLLFSLSIGLIVLSFNKKLEINVASVIFSGLLWKLWMDRKKEKFQGAPTGKGASGNEVVEKLKAIEQKNVFQPSGLFSSAYVEGFEDATPSTSTTPSAPAQQPSQPTTTGTAAPTNAPTATPELAKAVPKATTTPTAPETPTTTTTSGFSDKLTDGMFKLGSIPADVVGGSHIDIGTTMMNALNALKPDQIKQMTDDTRKLLETQKSLMGMLGTMKPMLQDGKQLMSTFNDMFGKGGNPMAGMSL